MLVLEQEKARPFSFGVGRNPQVDLSLAGAFPFLLSPPLFGGVFPGQATRVAVLEEALRGEKAWTSRPAAGRLPPPPPSRCAPPGRRHRAPSGAGAAQGSSVGR